MVYFSIVESSETIISSLAVQENFTDLTIIQQELAVDAQRVSLA